MIQVHGLRLTLVQSVASAWTVPQNHLVVFQNDGCLSQLSASGSVGMHTLGLPQGDWVRTFGGGSRQSVFPQVL